MTTVQIVSICVSIVGWLSTLIASGKILSYRIKKLEDKIDRINDIYDRIAVIEYVLGIGYHAIKGCRKFADVAEEIDKMNKDNEIERDSASVE